MKVTLLGHATVLVETGEMRILMDPVLEDPFENGMVIDYEISQLRAVRG